MQSIQFTYPIIFKLLKQERFKKSEYSMNVSHMFLTRYYALQTMLQCIFGVCSISLFYYSVLFQQALNECTCVYICSKHRHTRQMHSFSKLKTLTKAETEMKMKVNTFHTIETKHSYCILFLKVDTSILF